MNDMLFALLAGVLGTYVMAWVYLLMWVALHRRKPRKESK